MIKLVVITFLAVVVIGCNTVESVSNFYKLTAREQEWYKNQSVSVQQKIDALDSTSLSELRSALSMRLDLSDDMSELCDEMNKKFNDAKFEMNYR